MANPDRLTGLDTAFLHLEDHSTAHMHVASVMVFEGQAPTPQELVDHVQSRLHLVPRYRQRLAYVPLDQGRPVWTDDPHFNPHYHIRHTALPRPGDEAALKRLAGRLFSQRLDRSKPLWEIWLVERMAGRRFALIAKTHHALVDGISGRGHHHRPVRRRARARAHAASAGAVEPRSRCPGSAKLLGEALLERATVPGEMARGARAHAARAAPGARAAAGRPGERRRDHAGGHQRAGAPRPLNVDIGPHRRYTFLDADLARFKAIKDSLGGTLNDVVLAVRQPRARPLAARRTATTPRALVLKAMVPVSVRADAERGALGNQRRRDVGAAAGRRRGPRRVPASRSASRWRT